MASAASPKCPPQVSCIPAAARGSAAGGCRVLPPQAPVIKLPAADRIPSQPCDNRWREKEALGALAGGWAVPGAESLLCPRPGDAEGCEQDGFCSPRGAGCV